MFPFDSSRVVCDLLDIHQRIANKLLNSLSPADKSNLVISLHKTNRPVWFLFSLAYQVPLIALVKSKCLFLLNEYMTYQDKIIGMGKGLEFCGI